jgi:hypothetical protein
LIASGARASPKDFEDLIEAHKPDIVKVNIEGSERFL